MAVSIQIDKRTGVATIECSGTLRFDDAVQAAKELWSTADWPGKAAVWNFIDAEFDLSSSDVRQIAKFILAHQREVPPERMAFVVSRQVDYGMARMFETLREDPRTTFRVFRDRDEALGWAQSLDTPEE